MPWVRQHTRNGRKVRAHYRVGSKVAWVVGILLLVVIAAIKHKQG